MTALSHFSPFRVLDTSLTSVRVLHGVYQRAAALSRRRSSVVRCPFDTKRSEGALLQCIALGIDVF